ncbi:MAG: trypsin-like peptidase domain-containing protein [Phycisphaerae bacterium]|nr:trypsin-like peptidase domain-containing protein [Planctomycetota bacterium]MBL7220958.1 trypsin-like peptidase domain-containing protein [Phycisphaerae bacterium]
MIIKRRARISHAAAFVAVAACLAAGCAQLPDNPVGSRSSKPAIDPHDAHSRHTALDDLARMRNLTAKATKLLDSGKATSMEILSKQLNRKQCKLSLPTRLTKQLTRSEIYRKNLDSVLIVARIYKCSKCTKWHAGAASGFALTSSGAIATNYHLFESKNKQALVAMTSDGKTYAVKEVLAAGKTDDAVILQLDMGAAKLKPLALAPDAPVGTEVAVISHPNHRFYSLTEGVVSRYSRQRTKRGTTDMMTITADFAKGSSGAPVFDDRGNVAAMVASTSSVYYTQTRDAQKNLQMVFKQCVPAASILKLIAGAGGRR